MTDFAEAAAILTNGNNDYAEFVYQLLPGEGGGARGAAEADWLRGGLTGVRSPDLFGTTITHVLLILDEVAMETPGRDPNSDGNWTDFDLEIRVVIFGET